MLWEDDTDKVKEFMVPDDVVDIAYRINCKQVPTTHAHELAQALYAALPWLQQESEAGIHQIHGATSGNGWYRPADGELIHLSKRARMTLRVPKARVDDAKKLIGQTLNVAGNSVEVGKAEIKLMQPLETLFSRYVVVPEGYDENAFIQWVVDELKQRDIHIRKLLCGISHTISTPDEAFETRSVMLADLDKSTSLGLQEQGLGPHRHYGCGIFMPHKGIKAVGDTADKTHFSGT